MRTLTIMLGLGALLAATPSLAETRKRAVQDDSNSWWLDYKTDISEARRELTNDLGGAKKQADKDRAWAEYRREVADARDDYNKEMGERGYRPGRFARVSIQDVNSNASW